MIGSIHFEKIWEDGELIEIAVVIDSEHITAKHNYYTTKTKISSLQEHLKAFTECRDTRFDWISADGVTSEVPRFSLICTHMDNKGHVKVEITMDMNFIFCIFLLYAYIHNKDVTFEMDKLQKDMNTRRIKYDKR